MGDVGLEVDDGILTISLRRPQRRNAMTRTMIADLVAAIDYADGADDVKAVILTGTGGSFCAGAELSSAEHRFGQEPAVAETRLDAGRDSGGILALRLFAATKPLVAAVNGDAVGIGASMILPMDVRIASATARFGYVQSRRGIALEGCASWFLPRVVGMDKALQWAMSGRVFPADEALAAGLVRSVETPEMLMQAARQAAVGLIDHAAPVSVAATRRMLWHGMTVTHPMQVHRIETAVVRALGAGPDAREGVASFLEKRPAKFTSKPSEVMNELESLWPIPPFAG